jgi:hypothetical protein
MTRQTIRSDMEEDVSSNDGVRTDPAPVKRGFNAASVSGYELDETADIPEEDWGWLQDLTTSAVESTGALSAAARSIIDTAGTSAMLSAAFDTSGITRALANLADTNRILGTSVLTSLSPGLLGLNSAFAGLADSVRIATSLNAALDTSGIRQAFANLADTNRILGTSVLTSLTSAMPTNVFGSASASVALGLNSAFAGLPDSTQMTTALHAAIKASGFASTYATAISGILGTSRISETLSSALLTPSLTNAFTALQQSLLSLSSTAQLAGSPDLFTGLGVTLDDLSVPSGGSARPSFREEWQAEEFTARLAQITGVSDSEQQAAQDTAASPWIKRHNEELTLAIGALGLLVAVLALVVALLAWLYPRSTPTPVQVKVVWTIVESCLGDHAAIAPGHVPASHVPGVQPTKIHDSR